MQHSMSRADEDAASTAVNDPGLLRETDIAPMREGAVTRPSPTEGDIPAMDLSQGEGLPPLEPFQDDARPKGPIPGSRPGVRELPFWKAFVWSVGLHVIGPIVATVFIVLVMRLPWEDWFKPRLHKPDMQFILVQPEDSPAPDKADYLAQANQRAGGKKAQAPQGVDQTPESQASSASPASKPTDAKPQAKPTPKQPKPPAVATEPSKKQPKPPSQGDLEPIDELPDDVIVHESGPNGESGASSPTTGSAGSTGVRGSQPGDADKPGVNARAALFGKYMETLKRRLRRNWQPPRGEESRKIAVLMIINRDGSLKDTKIYESSGSEASDKAAIEAVEASAPFPTLPTGYAGESVPILFTFDYTVLSP